MSLEQMFEFVSATDPGMVRTNNEDSIACDPSRGLAVLADGMGGYNAGEVASGIATTVITTELQQLLEQTPPYMIDASTGKTVAEKILRDQVSRANTSIYEAAQSQPQYEGMGTTLVVALYYDNKMAVAHVGDSRLYLYRDEKFEQITRDHSVLQEQIDSGLITKEQAKVAANKNLVTRALGIEPTVETEIHEYETKLGDIYLLCSDGLCDMVSDEDIGDALQMLGANLELCVQQLVQMANDNGGRDNVSVILIRILREFPAPRGVLSKVFGWLR
jgi:PPM family protein phosphatase